MLENKDGPLDNPEERESGESKIKRALELALFLHETKRQGLKNLLIYVLPPGFI